MHCSIMVFLIKIFIFLNFFIKVNFVFIRGECLKKISDTLKKTPRFTLNLFHSDLPLLFWFFTQKHPKIRFFRFFKINKITHEQNVPHQYQSIRFCFIAHISLKLIIYFEFIVVKKINKISLFFIIFYLVQSFNIFIRNW